MTKLLARPGLVIIAVLCSELQMAMFGFGFAIGTPQAVALCATLFALIMLFLLGAQSIISHVEASERVA